MNAVIAAYLADAQDGLVEEADCPEDADVELGLLELGAREVGSWLELHLAWQRLRRTEAARVGDREVPS